MWKPMNIWQYQMILNQFGWCVRISDIGVNGRKLSMMWVLNRTLSMLIVEIVDIKSWYSSLFGRICKNNTQNWKDSRATFEMICFLVNILMKSWYFPFRSMIKKNYVIHSKRKLYLWLLKKIRSKSIQVVEHFKVVITWQSVWVWYFVIF